MKKKLNELTIKEASEKLKNKEISSLEIVRSCLDKIREIDGEIKACLTVCEDEAISAAKEADKKREQGEDGDLLGIPYVAKDNILTKGVKTTAASKILEDYVAPYDADIVKKLKKEGAVLIAKTNLDEFAHGASTENSAFGPSHNPWNLERVPGGSSGGSAAAVAADMCLFALGTDTGGSIRCPSSFCGVVGLKPSYGRSSRFGLIAMTSSTDVPGPITKTAEDASMVLGAIAGHSERDASTPDVEVADYSQEIGRDIKGLKLGMPEEYFDEGIEVGVKKNIEEAIEKLKSLGAEIKSIKLPHTKYCVPVYYIITPSEISSNLARHDGIRFGLSEEGKDLLDVYKNTKGKGFGPEAKRRIMLGTYALSAGYYDAYYLKAQKVRTKIKEELDAELENLDAIITPTQPDTAFKIGEHSDDILKMYLEDVFVAGASLAGLPAISIPCGFIDGLPVGMQLIGKRFDEAMLFRISSAYQRETEWHKQKASL